MTDIQIPRCALEMARFASTNLTSPPNIINILFEFDELQAHVVATDGHQLAVLDVDLPEPITKQKLAIGADAVLKICKAKARKCEPDVFIFDTATQIIRHSSGTQQTVALSDPETFPDYRNILPALDRDQENIGFVPFQFNLSLLDTLRGYLKACGDEPYVTQLLGAGNQADGPILFSAVVSHPARSPLTYILMPMHPEKSEEKGKGKK